MTTAMVERSMAFVCNPAKSLLVGGAAVRARKCRRPMSMQSTDASVRPNILVLGGGVGGLYTTLHLMNLPWTRLQQPKITLVDQADRFVFLPLLYEFMSGSMTASEMAPLFAELLAHTDVNIVQGKAQKLDVASRTVSVLNKREEETTLSYDRLVCALGAEPIVDLVEGAKDHAFRFYSFDDAVALKEKIRALKNSDKSTVKAVIVGGGFTGIELAAMLAEIFGDRGSITVLTRDDDILLAATEHNKKAAVEFIDRLGVHVETNASVKLVEENSVTFSKGDGSENLEADVTIMTAGSKPRSLGGAESLPKNERGQILTTKTLQVKENPDIFAIGDNAACFDSVSKKQTASTAQAALQQADYASWNIYASVAKEPNLTYKFFDLGQMMCLGNKEGTVSALGAVNLSGLPGAAMRRGVYLARMPTDLHRLRTSAQWAARPFVSKANKTISELLRSTE